MAPGKITAVLPTCPLPKFSSKTLQTSSPAACFLFSSQTICLVFGHSSIFPSLSRGYLPPEVLSRRGRGSTKLPHQTRPSSSSFHEIGFASSLQITHESPRTPSHHLARPLSALMLCLKSEVAYSAPRQADASPSMLRPSRWWESLSSRDRPASSLDVGSGSSPITLTSQHSLMDGIRRTNSRAI